MKDGEKKTVFLLRGPSGCGKTTYADFLKKEFEKEGKTFAKVSADDLFEVEVSGLPSEGTRVDYVWDPARLSEAHQECFAGFQKAMAAGTDVVVVDNTFVRMWEVENYLLAAKAAGYQVRVMEWRVQTVDQLRMLAARNKHGVPGTAVARQAMEFELMWGAEVVPIRGKANRSSGGAAKGPSKKGQTQGWVDVILKG